MSLFIGLMSGTSADGMDAALVRFQTGQAPELVNTYGLPYDAGFSQQLRKLAITAQASVEELALLDRKIAQLSVKAVKQLLKHSDIKASEVTAIGSHGHTLRHKALRNRELIDGFSWQLGDPSWIAEHTGICCVADFRRRDIAAGGQGAPLVPAFHQACLSSPDKPRMVLNLGGISNLTVLGESLRGFDCGPGNALMDEWCSLIWQQPRDVDGERAAQGKVITHLLSHWQSHGDVQHYLQQPPPKSTGRELFHLQALGGDLMNYDTTDILATLSQLTATTVADAVNRFGHHAGEVLVCGGGIHNQDLMRRIKAELPRHQVLSTEHAGIHPDWLEAIAFAWLAHQTMNHLPGNAPQVTGAHGLRILGGIYPA